MKGIRDTMNEILTVIQTETKQKIKHTFIGSAEVDEKVRSLVFRCMHDNLAYYLGLSRVGYIVVNRHQRVKLHPSSTLLSLNVISDWVVFSKVLKTSEDFITEVTPIPHGTIENAKKRQYITSS